jgi:large repetitive protein
MITGLRAVGPWSVRRLFAYGMALTVAVVSISCDRVALFAPAGSTITLSALTSTVPLNGSTSIIAQVIEPAGTPPNKGTLVTFTADLGAIIPVEAETDSGGRAMVVFKAGALSGTATISALSGGVTTGTTGALKIAIGAAGVTTIGITANPGAIAPGATSSITATLSDSNGRIVVGVPVTFSTDNGSLGESVVTTDANGQASTVLTTTKTAKVTATAGVATTSTSGTTTTTTAAPTASITVTVEPLPTASISASANAQVNLPVTFTITAQPGAGSSTFIQDVAVDFGDGAGQDLGAATGTSTVQHVYLSSGSKTARVAVIDSNGGKTAAATVVFVQTQAPIVAITIDSSTTVGVTKTVNFRATVSPPGTSVAQYVWNFGDGESQTTFTDTVSHIYSTATLPRTATVTVTTTTNQTASNSTTVPP